MNSKKARLIVISIVLLVTVATDQVSKVIAREHLAGRARINVAGSFFVMVYAENQGAFLGLGSNWPPPVRATVFGVFSGIIVAAAIIYLFKNHAMPRVETVALSLIAGGGVGNMIDRISRGGAVSDFLNLGIGNIRTGVFNLADLYLMIGVFLFLITIFTEEKRTTERP